MKFWLYFRKFRPDLYKIRYSGLAQKSVELLWVARKSARRIPLPPVGQDLLIHDVCRSHTQNDAPQSVLSDNTHNRQTSMPPVGFELNISRRAATDLLLRQRGHWDPPHFSWVRKLISAGAVHICR